MLQAFQGEAHRPFLLEGGEPGAVLVHGFPGTPAEMRPVAEALHRQGWTAEGVLLPGFGPDIETMGQRTAAEWRTKLSDSVASMRRQHRPVLLIGNSMGAALSLGVAADSPPDGLVLLNPFWTLKSVLWQALPVLRLIFPQFRPFRLIRLNLDDPETQQGIRNFMPAADLKDPQVQAAIRDLAIPTGIFEQIRRNGREAFRRAPEVRCPVLVIQGKADTLAQPALSRQLAGRIGSQVEFIEVEAEHNLLNPYHPCWPRVRSSIENFANELKR